jgi:hypothetical protein
LLDILKIYRFIALDLISSRSDIKRAYLIRWGILDMSRLVLTVILPLLLGASGVSAATLVNGSLENGTVDTTYPDGIPTPGVPSGWYITAGTPDTTNRYFPIPGTDYIIDPETVSPDGGTFVSILEGPTSTDEGFAQQIIDLTIGQTYDLSWYAGNFGNDTGTEYRGSNEFIVLLDGLLVGSGGVLDLGNMWYFQSIQFEATATSQVLEFRLGQGSEQSYMSIDGIMLSDATSPVPVPAAVWLFGSGLIGLIGIARRKKV